jgi:hypothetical protein
LRHGGSYVITLRVETRPPKSKPPRRPLTYRKLFHWGIVFWLVVWLASACFLQNTRVLIKDGGASSILIGEGAVSLRPPGAGFIPLRVLESNHKEIWSPGQLNLIRNYPEILIAKLGKLGVAKQGHSIFYSFPIAGILWVWLAAGLYGEMKLLRHPAALPEGTPGAIVGSRKRVVMLGGAVLALGVVIGMADHMSRKVAVAHACAMRIRLSQAAWGETPVADPLFSDSSWSPGSSFERCPCDTTRSPVPPEQTPMGKYAGQCPRADHRRYLAGLFESE